MKKEIEHSWYTEIMYRKCISRISTKKQFGQIILLSFEEAEKRKIENLLRVAWRQSGTKQHQQIQKKKNTQKLY